MLFYQKLITDKCNAFTNLSIALPRIHNICKIQIFQIFWMSKEEQDLLFGGHATLLHLEPGDLDYSCDTLTTFQEWSDVGVIIPGDWSPLLNAQGCTTP